MLEPVLLMPTQLIATIVPNIAAKNEFWEPNSLCPVGLFGGVFYYQATNNDAKKLPRVDNIFQYLLSQTSILFGRRAAHV
jgi:hypothetical protein